jgi:hypothetical protein
MSLLRDGQYNGGVSAAANSVTYGLFVSVVGRGRTTPLLRNGHYNGCSSVTTTSVANEVFAPTKLAKGRAPKNASKKAQTELSNLKEARQRKRAKDRESKDACLRKRIKKREPPDASQRDASLRT